MTVQIYDGMAVCRRKFDFDPWGKGPRSIVTDMLGMPRTDVAVWCWEGKGSLVERRKVYAGYKVRPSTMTDGLTALIDLTRKALAHTRALQVAVPGREADDVIAHLCQVHGNGDNVVVHTIDRDLKALETAKVKVDCDDLKTILPREIRMYKTLVGDASDKIPGMPGFGIKTFMDCDRRLLQFALDCLVRGQADPALWIKAGVKEGMANRICDPEQAKLLCAFHNIIGFLPLPHDWDQHVIPGREDAAAADAVLKEFMH